jgi:hypothetical protein
MLSKGNAAPSKSENSVLFSLKELRRLEDERLQAEADARKAQAEAERRAKADAEQRAREEEARRVREAEERRKRAESEREAREREDRLRLEEAERRARVEGELKLKERQLLEEQKQRHLHGRRSGKTAWIAGAAGVALTLAVGGGLMARASQQHQAEKEAFERVMAQTRAEQLAFEEKIRALEEKARREIGEAKTPTDRARILGDLQRQKRAVEVARQPPSRRTAPPTPPIVAPTNPTFRVPPKRVIPDDPVGGLPDIKSGAF